MAGKRCSKPIAWHMPGNVACRDGKQRPLVGALVIVIAVTACAEVARALRFALIPFGAGWCSRRGCSTAKHCSCDCERHRGHRVIAKAAARRGAQPLRHMGSADPVGERRSGNLVRRLCAPPHIRPLALKPERIRIPDPGLNMLRPERRHCRCLVKPHVGVELLR